MIMNAHRITSLKITVLVENRARRPSLVTEHGLALWIEADDHRILLDTGLGKALIPNAWTLGIPFSTTQAIVLSHGHLDHTGGLPELLRRGVSVPIFMHPDAGMTRYSTRKGHPRPIGMPQEIQTIVSVQAVICHTPTTVFPGIWATGPISRRNDEDNGDRHLFLDEKALQPDIVTDDQSLVVETSTGSVIITGCCHSGILATIEAVRQANGDLPIVGIVGGLHLMNIQSDNYLLRIADCLRALNVPIIAVGHCTGERAEMFLDEHLPNRVRPIMTGDVMSFGASSQSL